MKTRIRFPLLAKVLGWLLLHLLLLGLAFFLFVRWQLGLGLDSLISGSAGDRLTAFGDSVIDRIEGLPPHSWNEEIHGLAKQRGVAAAIVDPFANTGFPQTIPGNVLRRARGSMPPQRGEPVRPPGPPGAQRPPRRYPPGDDDPPPGMEPRPGDGAAAVPPASRPVFLMRAEHGDGYWAGVLVHPAPLRPGPRRPALLLIRADRLDGAGMFFDFKPWLWGGIAVLLLSLAFWTPFVWSISRYLHRLTAAADQIAAGRFQVSLPPRGNDELGNLGQSIETMATRLDHLVTGQKRFLGDAAHELCAPLARIRTGLGILEGQSESPALASIEADTAELAALVHEILAFSRAGMRAPSRVPVEIEPMLLDVLAKEAGHLEIDLSIPPGLVADADPALLARAAANLVRNTAIHAGPGAKLAIHASSSADQVTLTFTDNGPGVPAEELPRLFEPFHRVDRSRSRDTGGSGLGLAIVRTAIESCGGRVGAAIPQDGGFQVTLNLMKSAAHTDHT